MAPPGPEMGSMPYFVAAAILLVIAVVALRRPLRAWRERREAERARRDFRRQREMLEARFFDLAAASGKPRGLRWTDCEFGDGSVSNPTSNCGGRTHDATVSLVCSNDNDRIGPWDRVWNHRSARACRRRNSRDGPRRGATAALRPAGILLRASDCGNLRRGAAASTDCHLRGVNP